MVRQRHGRGQVVTFDFISSLKSIEQCLQVYRETVTALAISENETHKTGYLQFMSSFFNRRAPFLGSRTLFSL